MDENQKGAKEPHYHVQHQPVALFPDKLQRLQTILGNINNRRKNRRQCAQDAELQTETPSRV